MTQQNQPGQQQQGTKQGQQNPMPGKPGQSQQGSNPSHQSNESNTNKK